MSSRFLRILIRIFSVIILYALVGETEAKFYDNSYALVIGINQYTSPKWENLKYAIDDAQGMANFLKEQNFNVKTLFDKQATKTAIISEMEDYLAPQVKKNDRILFFFAGHGHTKFLGGKDWGYIVPYDAGDSSATYISMEEIQTLAAKMGTAKHQLFIMDACYGGLLGTKAGGIDPNIPNYLVEITKRKAVQIITAGGKKQTVLNGGPYGHSVFTGSLLEALKEAKADLNGDGYITFAELVSYLVPKATTAFQTPAHGILPGHSLGEFVFRSPKGATKHIPEEPVPPKGRLFVKTVPKNANVKILNISQPFIQGMELEPGYYHLEVSAISYETEVRKIELIPAENKLISIKLERVSLIYAKLKERLKEYKGSSLVVASWGGSYQNAQRKAYYEPFEKEFGIKIVEVSSADISKVMAMVIVKNVEWDVVIGNPYELDHLGNEGYLEELDYNIIDKTDVDPFFYSKWYMSTISWSELLGYRTDVFPGDKAPTSAVDFWDVNNFPGPRAMRDHPFYNIPLALIADGVPKDQIYPLDEAKIQRAFKKLDEIKPYIKVWWTQGVQPPQLLAAEEVVMATGWNEHFSAIVKEGAPVDVLWEGAQLASDAWFIPKGTKKKELAMLFIAWASLPERNWQLSQYIDYGPVNKKSLQYLSKDILERMPLLYADKMIKCDFAWWSTNYRNMLERWREWKLR